MKIEKRNVIGDIWFLIRPAELWLGVRWETETRRLYINFCPCLVVCVVLPYGLDPKGPKSWKLS